MSKISQLMADAKFYESYGRYRDDLDRYETWEESVQRVMDMHYTKYKDVLSPELEELMQFAQKAYSDKLILGAQRALQFGGEQLLAKNAKMYNCFSEDTSFVTVNGIKTFKDFNNKDTTTVLTHTGKWKKAIVKQYGKQQLNLVTFKRNSTLHEIKVTGNHRWLLNNGTETTSLKVGDQLRKPYGTFNDFNYDDASPFEKLYWCYGMVYGDGTKIKNKKGEYKYSMIRLCERDTQFEYRFKEVGFKTSTNQSLKGDTFAYTGSYLKTPPNPDVDAPNLVRAFVAGYLQADGEKNRSNSKGTSKYVTIQASDEEHINFIRNCFPIAGVWIISETDLTNQVTNYGIRPYTIKFRINDSMDSKFTSLNTVVSIKPYETQTVWCLEVEDDHSFVLSNGIVTGNCTSSYCDRSAFFKEAFWLMLCGCGIGFSVQKQHIAKLPNIKPRNKQSKAFVVQDSIEGWANAVGALMSSFFDEESEYAGRKIYFDTTNIRPKGAEISGGFKAPGPEPLDKALKLIEQLIKDELSLGATKLRPIVAYDIMMYIADAVISGGVRRAATICLFSHDDIEMITAKTGDWFIKNPQRGRSNNSAVLLRNSTQFEEFEEIMKSVQHSGEPGFVWTDDLEILFNPSLRKGTNVLTKEGIIPIEKLENKDIQVRDIDGEWKNAKCRLSGKNKPLYKLRIGNRYDYYATKEHKWAVIYKDGMVKKTTTELLPGDKIPRNHLTSLDDSINKKGNYSDGFLIGWLYGDGWITDKPDRRIYGFIVSEKDNKSGIADILVNKLNSIKNNNTRKVKANIRQKEGQKPWYEFCSSDKNVDSYFKEFKVDKKEYGLPASLFDFSFSEEYRKGFIDGLYSADGFVAKDKNGIGFTTSQPKMADDLIEFLGFYGIVCYRTNRKHTASFPNGKDYHKEYLSIRININKQEDIWWWRKTFKFTHKDKQEVLNNKKFSRFYYPKQSYTTVTSVEDSGLKEDVWDISVYADNHCFQLSHCITGNCVEVGMYGYTASGQSGWQMCNLTEIAGARSTSLEIFLKQCKAGAILGTLQAGYTTFDYLTDATKEIVEREALIGVGITGWMNQPDILFDKENQRLGAEEVKKWNKIVADLIGINQAARTTVVKPSGNASVLLQCASGIHGEHAPRYIRHVQMNKLTEVAKLIKKTNPTMVEDSAWGGEDYVIGFPIEPIKGSIYKKDLLGVKQLEYVKNAQENWIEYGTNKELCVKPFLRHNVSNTITVDDWEEVTKYIYENRNSLCGISLLPAAGDKAYPQAPFTEVLTHQQIVDKYGEVALFTSALIEAGLLAFHHNLWTACDTALGFGEELTEDHKDLLKRDFIRRFDKFSVNFSSKEECANCLKDVYNLHKWWRITSSTTDINWATDLGQKEFVDINTLGSQACSGGKCEIEF